MARTQLTATGHGDLEASFVLIFPLLLAYEIGVLFVGRVNGADVVTRALYAIAGNRTVYLLIYAALAGLYLFWIRKGNRWSTLRVEVAAPVILEAAIYALTLGALITIVLDRLLGLGITGNSLVAALAGLFLFWIRKGNRWSTLRVEVAAPVILEAAIYALTLGALITIVLDRLLGLGITGNSLVAALGAGVHEELVFRLGLFAGFVTLLAGLERRFAVALALVTSSLLFAAAHHLGAHGEPFSAHAFAFRTLAGMAFGAIFWFRSLAHAVYAHMLYDLVVAASS